MRARSSDRPSSLDPDAWSRSFTFISPLGLLRVPMTRAHARLLGPCFKTGPESTQSYSVADGRPTDRNRSAVGVGPRKPTPTTARKRMRRLCPAIRVSVRVCAGPDALNFRGAPPPATWFYRPPSAGLIRVPTPCGDGDGSATGNPKPKPHTETNGSRRPTGGEVHRFVFALRRCDGPTGKRSHSRGRRRPRTVDVRRSLGGTSKPD